jgi:hypothetical protein
MPLPTGEIGGVKKKTLIIGGASLGGLVIVVVWMRSKKASQSSANQSSVTDPAGNVCAALDPNSGYCPGTPQDLQYQTAVGTNAASYVGGQIIGYDGNGNPIYSSSGPITGPGSYVNNAEWAQASESYIVQNEPNADPAIVGAALGAYIEGQPVSSSQKTIIEQAIAFEGLPPVPGTNGDPPNINENGGTGGTTTTKVVVPKVTGLSESGAVNKLQQVGLTAKINGTGTIVSQTPAAGAKVDKGSNVDLHAVTKSTTKPVKKTIPNVVGKTAAQGEDELKRYGFTVGVNGSGFIVSQTPRGGTQANTGSRVDIHAENKNKGVRR